MTESNSGFPTGTGTPALELLGVTRKFGALTALEDVSFTLRRNSIHALLGENGAGKTTLMRVAFGMIQPDGGVIRRNGQRISFSSPSDAIAAGIGMVHQQYSLIPAMTVAENVALGGQGRLKLADIELRIKRISEATGLAINPRVRVQDLTASERQKVEIVRTLAHDAGVLILDEPTAVLTSQDIAELFGQLRRFANSGGSVVLITHKLSDALEHADEVTVLRRGKRVMSASTAGVTHAAIAEAMLGTTSTRLENTTTSSEPRPVLVRLRNARIPGVRSTSSITVDLDLRAGEILGVAALDGAAGPLLRALAGRLPLEAEDGVPSELGFVPENRQEEALVPEFSLAENFALKDAAKRVGLLDWERAHRATSELLTEFDIRASGSHARASELSGGNQQRFVLGRELRGKPRLLVLENPTQGLDASAAALIHERLRSARNDGVAIVFYSSDLDEMLALADRVLVVNAEGVQLTDPDRTEVGRLLLPGSGDRENVAR